MLKFRFRKKEMRRRSNSCPNLDSVNSPFGFGSDIQHDKSKTQQAKHASCYLERNSDVESENEDEVPTASRKERRQAQKSIRWMKKKEKELQENAEKNMLSFEDFWRKIDTLKEWLHEEKSKEEVEKMQSPRLRSHFKKFVRLWNKRKLPTKYYRHCCLEGEEGSSGADIPNPQTPVSEQTTLDLFPHKTLRDLPSYHKFPFIDDHIDELNPTFTSLVSLGTEADGKDVSLSSLSTFGKDLNNHHFSTSLLAKQVELRQSIRNASKSKAKADHFSPSSSPKIFATISRSTPASSVFKSHTSPSPQLHPVLSPTCPNPPQFPFPPKSVTGTSGAESSSPIPGCEDDAKRPSPAYMSVHDAIPFACNSPKYWQVEFDDSVFESDYCSLSPLNSKTSRGQKNCPGFSKVGSNLNRRRSKSMEDIYAVPSRLMSFETELNESPLKDEIRLKTPPIPAKKFTPTPSMANLGVQRNSPIVKSESNDTLSSILVNRSETESRLVSISSDFSSVNSLSTDLGYQSSKYDYSGCYKNGFDISSFQADNAVQSSSSFRNCEEKAAVKRRSTESDPVAAIDDDFTSYKRVKPDAAIPKTKEIEDGDDNLCNLGAETKDIMVVETMDMVLPDYLKDPPIKDIEPKSDLNQQTPKLSILTGSLKPTTRTPKQHNTKAIRKSSSAQKKSNNKKAGNNSNHDKTKKDETRLSLLQIKVLDASPTFPRRRWKRRSSSLSVTPGKNLAFGNKASQRTAMSSPRRVSFAKNAKSGDDLTPTRNKSIVSKVSAATTQDISRQSQDKAKFESFWTRHEPLNKSKSPTQEKSSTLPWSPSKWLSLSKTVQSPSNLRVADLSVSSKSPTKGMDIIVKDEEVKKGAFGISLSPKKLFSSKQKNNSSSSLHSISSSTASINSGVISTKDLHHMMLDGKPKSILKSKSSFHSNIADNISNSNDLICSYQKGGDRPPQNAEIHSLDQDWFSKKLVNESDLSQCRSPPRLGVAALLTPKSPIMSHSKPISFDARLRQNNNVPQPFTGEMRTSTIGRLHTSNTNSLACGELKQTLHSNVRLEGNLTEKKEWNFDNKNVCPLTKPLIFRQVSAESNGSREGHLIQTNGTIGKYFHHERKIENKEETIVKAFRDCEMHSSVLSKSINGMVSGKSVAELTQGHWKSSNIKVVPKDKESTSSMTNENNRSSLSMNLNKVISSPSDDMHSIKYTNERLNNSSPVSNNEYQSNDQKGFIDETNFQPATFNSSNNASPNEEIYSLGCHFDEDDKDMRSSTVETQPPAAPQVKEEEISKNVLERIKSFRASPKVEDNDGWITERRRSRGSKPKSISSTHDHRHLLHSESPDPKEIETVLGLEVDDLKGKTNAVLDDGISGDLIHNTAESCCDVSAPAMTTMHDSQEDHNKAEITTSEMHCHENNFQDLKFDDGSIVDKGYETESGSRGEKLNRDTENESVSSVGSSDSGTWKFNRIPSCPIYDIPRNGVLHANICTDKNFSAPGDSLKNLPLKLCSIDSMEIDNTQLEESATLDSKNQTLFRIESNAKTNVPKDNISSPPLIHGQDADKENKLVPVRPVKPRPTVKPKPPPKASHIPKPSSSFSSKSLNLTSNKNSSSSPQPSVKRRSSVYKKDSPSVVRKGLMHSSQSSPKRRSSIIKKDFSSSGVACRSSVTSSSYKSNIDRLSRPVVRKSSSLMRRDDNASNKQLKNSVSNVSAVDENDKNGREKRDSLTPRKKRTSLEKGRRISSSAGPEKTSFAQRRKFFQQLQGSAATLIRASSQSGAKIGRGFNASESSKPQSGPKPAVKPKPKLQMNRAV